MCQFELKSNQSPPNIVHAKYNTFTVVNWILQGNGHKQMRKLIRKTYIGKKTEKRHIHKQDDTDKMINKRQKTQSWIRQITDWKDDPEIRSQIIQKTRNSIQENRT